MSELDRIHHFTINVSSLEQSLNWYQSSFNCRLISKTRTLAILEFENVCLTLALSSMEPTHLCIEKSNAADFGELREREDGLKTTFVSDPTGNIVELCPVSEVLWPNA